MSDPMQIIIDAGVALDAVAQRFDQFADEADAQIGEVAARHTGNSSTVYVDQLTGSDANAGTQDAPVATIQRAIDLSPVGLVNRIFVRGNYETTRRYALAGRTVQIFARTGPDWNEILTDADRPNMTVTFANYGVSSGPVVLMHGFAISYDAICNIHGFNFVLPSEAAVSCVAPFGRGLRFAFF